jgi:hypothetical protein
VGARRFGDVTLSQVSIVGAGLRRANSSCCRRFRSNAGRATKVAAPRASTVNTLVLAYAGALAAAAAVLLAQGNQPVDRPLTSEIISVEIAHAGRPDRPGRLGADHHGPGRWCWGPLTRSAAKVSGRDGGWRGHEPPDPVDSNGNGHASAELPTTTYTAHAAVPGWQLSRAGAPG